MNSENLDNNEMSKATKCRFVIKGDDGHKSDLTINLPQKIATDLFIFMINWEHRAEMTPSDYKEFLENCKKIKWISK